MKLDESVVIWSTPERERADRPLLVLLHGYGSHEGDLFQLSPGLPLDRVVASVRAPVAERGGWAWFSLGERAVGEPTSDEADAAADAVLQWLDTLTYPSVALLGFSQGAVVALQALRRAPDRFTSIVALSGFVADGTSSGDDTLVQTRPPVFWGRGTNDIVIADAAVERTADWLPDHSDATIRIYEQLGHGVSTPELRDIASFLREH
jgi:phospholipase/carboxylesterase